MNRCNPGQRASAPSPLPRLPADRLSVSRPLAEFVEKILRSREVGILSLGSAHLDSALWTRPIAIGFSMAGRSPTRLERFSAFNFKMSGAPLAPSPRHPPPPSAGQAGQAAPHARILPLCPAITQNPKTTYTYRLYIRYRALNGADHAQDYTDDCVRSRVDRTGVGSESRD
jgi:hypothetical protein